MTKIYNYIKSWIWLIKGKCYWCGGRLNTPWSEKKQYCSECGKNN